MSTLGTPQTPAGWYPDPQVPGQGRFWDGTAWTEQVHLPGQPYPAGPELKAPAGTDPNTPWVWLIIGIQLLPLLLMLLVPWGSMFAFDLDDPYASSTASLAVFASPFYWLAALSGWVVYGLSAFFASRDHAELVRRGVPRPFHWAFAFIGAAVYTIGRSVVAHRRTGKGHAPLWAEIGVIALGFVVTIVILVIVFSGMAGLFEQIATYRP